MVECRPLEEARETMQWWAVLITKQGIKAKSKDEESVTQKQFYSPLQLRHNGQVGNKRGKISEY